MARARKKTQPAQTLEEKKAVISTITKSSDEVDNPSAEKQKTSDVSPILEQSAPPETGTTRHRIATMYVKTFLGIIGGTLVIMLLFRCSSIDDIKNVLPAESGVLSGPLGFIIGFYFKEDIEKNNKL